MLVAFIILLAALGLLIIIVRNHALGMTHFVARPISYSAAGGLVKIIKTAICGFNTYRSRITHTPDAIDRAYSIHKIIPENGVELIGWYISSEERNGLIILVNWFGGCKSDNLEAAAIFLSLGYEVFLLDVRGHGDSSGCETYFGYYEYRDVLAGVEYVKHRFTPEKLIVYGVSLGAVATMRAYYAGEVKGVDALILESPFDRLANTIKHRVKACHLPEFFFADLLTIAGGIIQHYNPYDFNPFLYANDIDVPVLLLHGGMDPFVTCEEVERIFDNLQCRSNSQLVIIPEHRHGTAVFHCKHIFEKAVSGFLSEV